MVEREEYGSLLLTSFVGRHRELAALRALLLGGAARLVTLRGPAGVGKTRLLLEALRGESAAFPNGVHIVPLGSLHDPALVPAALAEALHLKETSDSDLPSTICWHLGEGKVLLVLDTVEHLLPAAKFVADLLLRCPRLTIAITSRAALHLAAEREFPVDPLPTPESETADLDTLARVDAIALFLDRARARDPSFTLTHENAAAIVEICRKLDGLPLAIELAAARMQVFSPADLLARLDWLFEVLTGGPVDLPARKRSLQAALDCSYHLLDKSEQRLFARLAVFAGTWTMDAAQRVVSAGSDSVSPVLDGIAAMIEQSLVQRRDLDGETRYGMLDSIRAYALDRLRETDDYFPVHRQFARYCAEFAEEANKGLRGESQEPSLRRLEAEYPNLRAALTWSLTYELETAARLVTALCYFWYMHGRLSEGRRWIDEVLDRPAAEWDTLEPWLHGELLNAAGVLDWQMGEYVQARQLLAGAVTIRRALGDTGALVASLMNLGNVLCRMGNFEQGGALFEESLALARERADTWDIAASLNNLGNVAESLGKYDRAADLYAESLDLFRSLGDTWNSAIALMNLGNIAGRRGDVNEACALLEESLRLFRELGDPWSAAKVLNALADVVIRMGDFARGRALAEESLRLYRQVGNTGDIPDSLETLAFAFDGMGDTKHMTRLLAMAAGRRDAVGAQPDADRRATVSAALDRARATLGEREYEELWERSQSLSIDQALPEHHSLGSEGTMDNVC